MSMTYLTIRCKVCNVVIAKHEYASMGQPVKLDRTSVCVRHIPGPSSKVKAGW